jgi:hypothetical protein
MSVQAISGSTVQQYQPMQPTAQNGSQPTSQSTSGQKVKKGGGHHHHSKTQPASGTQTSSTTGGATAPLTASAVSGVGYSQSASGAATNSGGTISIYA